MILLELATAGTCFAGVADKALPPARRHPGHAASRGTSPEVRLAPARPARPRPARALVGGRGRGLAARRRRRRRRAKPQAGEPGRPSTLAGRRTTGSRARSRSRPARPGAWEEARALTLRGAVATWLEARGDPAVLASEVRRIASDAAPPTTAPRARDDGRQPRPAADAARRHRHARVAARASRTRLRSASLGEATRHLERIGREPWLDAHARPGRRPYARAGQGCSEVQLDEDRAQRRDARLVPRQPRGGAGRPAAGSTPTTDHVGLASLLGRLRPSEEDLVILVGAPRTTSSRPWPPSPTQTVAAAAGAGVALDPAVLPDLLARPRRELLAAVEQAHRQLRPVRQRHRRQSGPTPSATERRVALPRAATLLAVPPGAWLRAAAGRPYVADLLGAVRETHHGGRSDAGRWRASPSARPRRGSISPELGTGLRGPPRRLLAHVLARADAPIALDPAAWSSSDAGSGRAAAGGWSAHAETFKRDTGIDGQPSSPSRSSYIPPRGAASRIVPILLWPVALDARERSADGGAALAFDRDRGDEVRLNPALEGLLGARCVRPLAARRATTCWGAGRSVPADVVDAFGALASPPRAASHRSAAGARSLAPARNLGDRVPSAALFNVEFAGQAVAEPTSAEASKTVPPTGTALEAAIRVVAGDRPEADPVARASEADRYLTGGERSRRRTRRSCARASRRASLVEGPPGTGKSQTIVNIARRRDRAAARACSSCARSSPR